MSLKVIFTQNACFSPFSAPAIKSIITQPRNMVNDSEDKVDQMSQKDCFEHLQILEL
jgi:hypothetical protein